jgi:hypothetical protein
MAGAADVDLGAQVTAVEMEDERADVAADVEHRRPADRRRMLVAVVVAVLLVIVPVAVIVAVALAVIVVVPVAVIENGTHTASGRTS